MINKQDKIYFYQYHHYNDNPPLNYPQCKSLFYELNNKIRLIDVSQFMIENSSEFVGFVSGIISQDHDLQQMYFDSFLKIACLEDKDITDAVKKLQELSELFHIDF